MGKPTLLEIARVLRAEVDANNDDPVESRAMRLARDLSADPDTIGSTQAGRLRAAQLAYGLDPETLQPTKRTIARQDREIADRRPRARARRAAASAAAGRRRLRRIAPGVLILQSIGLVALYWFLREADSIARVFRGLGRALEWLRSTRGIPAPPGG